jgi:hypothetical protein
VETFVYEPYFYEDTIARELGKVTRVARYPRHPADDLPLIDTGNRAPGGGEPVVASAEAAPTSWLVRFGRRLATTATMWSL